MCIRDRLITVQSKADNKPYIILCEGKKGAKPGSVIEKPLVIYTKDGKHTNILKQIYSRSNMFYT